jgi:hypothetical protein
MNEVNWGELISAPLQAGEENLMNVLSLLLLGSWMPTPVARRENLHHLWGLAHQQPAST